MPLNVARPFTCIPFEPRFLPCMISCETTPSPAPVESARAAGLRYVSDTQPGISRRVEEGGFSYWSPAGEPVTDPATLDRIKALVIPPAWTQVWICPHKNGHLQAVGRDARDRKQYRYHERWRETRDESKYERMMAFAEALPKIRRRTSRDLRLRGMPREKVLATVVRLLETTLIRIGNDEYAQTNKSYGLTTLRNKHVSVRGAHIKFSFVGKSGKRHLIGLEDPELAKIVRHCQDLPGQELFGYTDEDGNVHDVTSEDVNSYLREITGAEFTAKDFRTWNGTVLAAKALSEFEKCGCVREAKRNISQAIKAVSQILGNTPAICRKCYVHPVVLANYLKGETIALLRNGRSSLSRLKIEEAAVMLMLQQTLLAVPGKK
ncbi:MAG: topoisomerase [Chthoniobacteraceae bacterium]|nr:topoisomerase [Chthoniobacteraceae bacterium]